ncbi:MAG: hypothetical protein LBP72_01840 [Dysgonamonadaceae bacterium]|nr:hypothetical protein [Dysgonamonadaceae bacterium]
MIVIYNHKYDKNIPLIERLYKDRFSTIYHLVPFYTGDRENVIPVYENSKYFQGYVAQGLNRFYNERFTHYFFVADDMILHPDINENNYFEYFNLDEKKSFISDFFSIYKSDWFWPHTKDAVFFQVSQEGIEVKSELPDAVEAEKRLLKTGAINRPLQEEEPLKWKHLYGKLNRNLFYKKNRDPFLHWLNDSIHKKRYSLTYPLAGSYSDIFIVSAQTVKTFGHYCGVFAALKLFVEIALPTALALSSEAIVTESDLPIKGKPLWKEEINEYLSPYQADLELLMKNFPDVLYIHPIKLSRWN